MNWHDLPRKGQAWPEWLETARKSNGVYVIQEKGIFGTIVYVGESHSGHLARTLMRHFQHWTGKTAGPTYGRQSVRIAVIKTRKENAVEMQNALIAEHSPRDNTEGKPGFWG